MQTMCGFCFFKQKTAYEMRISDWSSDVCSSDLERVLDRDPSGAPLTRWDGETMKPHLVTGKPVPDEAARVEVYRYVKPRAAAWPKADFIVGNPPFVSSRETRELLGAGRSEERRVGQECVSTGISRSTPGHLKKIKKQIKTNN